MNYIDTLNKEIKAYFNILCDNDYPDFIDKYINTEAMQRLGGIGQFCGMDYTNLEIVKPKYWYSRLDHSIAVSLIVWNLTKDKIKTLTALFHDLGTPVFSHTIDYYLNDYINQESSELNIKDQIIKSNELVDLLNEDTVPFTDVSMPERYPILENSKPKLCADRLDGILHTLLIWGRFWPLKDVKKVYKDIIILKNEDNEEEIGFKTLKQCEKFFSGSYEYSILLQKNEDKLMMHFLGDIIKFAIDRNILSFENIYLLSEKRIIELIENSGDNKLREMWHVFTTTSKLYSSNEIKPNTYCFSLDVKKRYVNPLCLNKDKIYRIVDISSKSKILLDKYMAFQDGKYAYIDYDFNKKELKDIIKVTN
ncbi:MAG: hypothetical protein PHQ89_00725 [Bacilli bacterium]|nr:hypothetical protein [Bacilli bacterium]